MKNSSATVSSRSFIDNTNLKWGWFLSVGIALMLLGLFAFANLATTTQATILYVGALMVIGGLMQIIHLFQVKSWSGFFYFLLSGVFYTAAGALAFQNPLLGAATFTLILAVALIFSGVFRIWSGMELRAQAGSSWVLASGLTTLFVGLVFVADWPTNSLWLLGMVLALDLIFQGAATVGLAFSLKSDHPISADLFPNPITTN